MAEAVVLSRLLQFPERIDGCDLEPMLVFPEHRLIWRSLQAVRREYPQADRQAFFGCWLSHIQEQWNLVDLVQDRREWERAEEERDNARHADPSGFDPAWSSYYHTLDEWLARLRRIAEARGLISAAQRMAERAWREDVDGAREVAGEAALERARHAWQAVLEV